MKQPTSSSAATLAFFFFLKCKAALPGPKQFMAASPPARTSNVLHHSSPNGNTNPPLHTTECILLTYKPWFVTGCVAMPLQVHRPNGFLNGKPSHECNSTGQRLFSRPVQRHSPLPRSGTGLLYVPPVFSPFYLLMLFAMLRRESACLPIQSPSTANVVSIRACLRQPCIKSVWQKLSLRCQLPGPGLVMRVVTQCVLWLLL